MIRRILLIIFILITATINVNAHPGNTDSSGGHSCFTNCAKWGYSFGEYHYHSLSNTTTSRFSFTQSSSGENNSLIYLIIVFGGIFIFLFYKIMAEPKNGTDLNQDKTVSTRYEIKNNVTKLSESYKYGLFTDEEISEAYIKDSDLSNLLNYCENLYKAYSDHSWFLTNKGKLTFIRLIGTTFENRQEHIKNLKVGQKVALNKEVNFGSIECFVDSKSIGIIPTERKEDVQKICLYNMLKDCYVESIRGGNDKYYGVVITIVLNDNVSIGN